MSNERQQTTTGNNYTIGDDAHMTAIYDDPDLPEKNPPPRLYENVIIS